MAVRRFAVAFSIHTIRSVDWGSFDVAASVVSPLFCMGCWKLAARLTIAQAAA